VAQAAASGAADEVSRSLRRSLTWSFRILCPLAVGAHFLAPDLLALLYGTRFVEAGAAMGLLGLGVLFFTLYEIMDTCIRGSGRTAVSTVITWTLLAIHCLLNLILIPRLQLLGVAISVATICFLACLVAGTYAGRTMQLRIPWIALGRALLLSWLTFVPYTLWHPAEPTHALLAAIPCLVLYAVAVLRIEAIDATDLRRIWATGTERLRLRARPG